MAYVLRSNTDGIISEFLVNKDSDTTIILLDGLPSNISCKRDVIQNLNLSGFSSIAPRYSWTWESEWEFLDHNPAEDIKKIINTIRNWEFCDLYNNVYYKLPSEKIIICWMSFWWIVALDCLDVMLSNDKCIIISPLCDMIKFTHDLREVRDFVKIWFWRAYNFKLENWDSMVVGKLFKTDYSLIKKKSNQISLIYDETDHSILESDLLKFCKETDIVDITKINWYWHLSYSKWDNKIYEIISGKIRE